MKNKIVLNRIIFILTVIIELTLCVLSCVKVNNKKYDNWIETEATILNVLVCGNRKAVGSGTSTIYNIFVNYQDNNKLIILVNYRIKLHEGDTLTIKYNPENQEEIIYLPYENYCIFIKRIKILIFFCVTMFITICACIQKLENEKSRIASERWFEEHINQKQ